jgi:hypothetical protein
MPTDASLDRRWLWRWAVGLLLAALAAARVAAVFTAAVNWDEFALLATADRTAETGIFHSAGRPGLGVLVLLPFVRDCGDEIEVARRARLLWLGFTAVFLAGLALLVARLQPDRARRGGDALWAVALLALTPAFLEWSIQVRTDQLALAAGAWGGVALLASRRRPPLALAAGGLFALGLLATQKLLYVGALVGVLAAGELLLLRELRPRREALRALLCLAALSLPLLAFEPVLAQIFPNPGGGTTTPMLEHTLSIGVSSFEFYRNTLGFSQYVEMLPDLVPHGILAALLLAATRSARGRARERLLLAWAVLALGLAVLLFHAGAFAYFWMTLGLFPAVAFAVARGSLCAWSDSIGPRARSAGAVALAGMLAIPAAFESAALLVDSQAVQRDSLDLVHRNFDRRDVGFQPEGALFCQLDPDPFPTYFSQRIFNDFAGAGREANAERLIDRFGAEPVKFLVHSWRLNQFPGPVRDYWLQNYQPYRDSVSVAGRRLGEAGAPSEDFDLVVSGRYRWLPAEAPRPIAIDGQRVPAGGSLELARGPHTAQLGSDRGPGVLVLALSDPPGPAPVRFYKRY